MNFCRYNLSQLCCYRLTHYFLINIVQYNYYSKIVKSGNAWQKYFIFNSINIV
jgi:hypothetical protein